jgi:PAS domain S-box-containing protein
MIGGGSFEQDYWRSAPRLSDSARELAPSAVPDDEFRLLADNIPTLCWIANGDGYIVWYNRRWHDYTGTTPEQMEGWGWQSVHDPEALPEVMERWTSSIATGEPFEMTFPLRGADGVFRPFLTRIQPVRDASGKIARWFGVNTEIGGQVAAERSRRENEERLQAIFDATPECIKIVAPDGTLLRMNHAGLCMVEAENGAQVEGACIFDVISPEHRREWEERHRRICAGESLSWEFDIIGLGGTRRRMETHAVPLPLREGGNAQLAVTRDVSQRKAAEQALLESEERFRQVFQHAAVGMIEIDADWNIRASNEVYREITGRLEEDLRGASCLSYTHPEDVSKGKEALQAIASGDTSRVTFEKRYLRPDGDVVWVRSSLSRVSGEQGESRFLKVVEDITEVRQAREALREESEALEILNRTAAQVAAELDLDRLVRIVTDAGVELTGAQFGAFFYNVINEAGEAFLLYALSGAERAQFDRFGMPRATAVFHPTFVGEGTIRSNDITKDERYGKNAPHMGMPQGHLPVRSYLAVAVISRSGEVIGGLFFGHEKAGVFSERSERLMTGLAAQAATGIDNARLYQAEQRLNQTLEAQVAEKTAERDRIWQVSQDMLGVADLDGTWRSVNPAWTRVLGWEAIDIVGRKSDWLEHPDDRERTREEIKRLAKGGATLAFVNRFRTRRGDYRNLSWTAVPVEEQLYCVARDVTEEQRRQEELEQTQERLRQAQKMETVGQLTGGVAHDFNNLLQIVTGNLDILLRNLPEDSARLRRAAQNAQRGAERAAILTQRLLAFSRRQPLTPKTVDVNKLVAGMSELLHRTLGETVEIETVLASNLWRVEADPNQLENSLLNLAINARDAMPEGGKLTVETQNTHLDRSYAAQNAEVSPGQYVTICVSDTGAGMDSDTIGRVFEPFFTTKEVGKGTGLGLSMVYGFVKQSGGHVKIYSEPGEGTTAKIYLPRLLSPSDDEEQSAEQLAPEGTSEETILVLEDDDDVRAYSVEVLRELGYRVIEAHDGPSALRLLERQEGRVDLLFSDVVLPGGLNGANVAEEARKLRPGLKVLFTTGYARNAIVHHGRLDPGVELITKPFSYADLAARVRDMLDKE